MTTPRSRSRAGTRILQATALAGLALAACDPEPLPAGPDAADRIVAQALPADAIVDAAGRARYLVRLDRAAAARMPRTALADPRFAAYHDAGAVHLVRAIEAQYGVAATQMTTLVGLTFTAFLTPEQEAALASDPRVQAITPDQPATLSSDAGSVWQDGTGTGVGSEHVSWGTTAVGTGTSAMRVYVLDTGVTPNPTELNLVQEVNAFCPNGEHNTACPTGTPAVVGCYRHSTHVAGIIGARSNTTGTRGVAAGVALVSVSVLDPTGIPSTSCIPESEAPTMTSLYNGLEWIKADVRTHGAVAVVNISQNGPLFVSGEVATAMQEVATPATGYPGAFIAESAGNGFTSACSVSYPAHSPSDGIMVVGMLNDHGQAVRPLNGINGERNQPLAADEPGSNYGPCVEAWAPGRLIFSTWSGSYQYLSGTSMAAPHVAGLAARLGGATPAAIEANVRAHLMALGSTSAGGDAIAMPTTNPLPSGVARNTPYAEVALASGASGGFGGATPGGTLSTYPDAPFHLGLDSVGAGAYTCDLARTSGATTVSLGSAKQLSLTSQSWPVGTWAVHSTACPSAIATVVENLRSSERWYVDNVDTTGGAITVAAGSGEPIRYASTNATSCDLTVLVTSGFGPFGPAPGYPHLNAGTAATVPIEQTPGPYQYVATCHDQGPSTSTATLNVTVTAGACTAGDVEECCPCGHCGCSGESTCNASGQWGGCRGYVCSPGVCP